MGFEVLQALTEGLCKGMRLASLCAIVSVLPAAARLRRPLVNDAR